MDRDHVVIMINRLVEDPTGDFDTLKRPLKVRKQHNVTISKGSPYLPLVGAGMLIFLLIEFQFFLLNQTTGGPPSIPSWFWLVAMVFQLSLGAWILRRFGRKIKRVANSNKYGMLNHCVECKYDLSSHESALGEELWVGPAVCPECGQRYPGIG